MKGKWGKESLFIAYIDIFMELSFGLLFTWVIFEFLIDFKLLNSCPTIHWHLKAYTFL